MSDAQRPRRTFRPARARFDPERAGRQSRVTRMAIDALGTPAAMLFLNAVDAHLGGRPIDLAGESDEALAQVEAALRAHRDAAPARPNPRDGADVTGPT